MGENPMGVKQFALGLGIAMLLPLSVYYAVELIRPAPKEDLLHARVQKVSQQIRSAGTEPEKSRLRGEKTALYQQFKESEKRNKQVLFVVGYLVGICAIILGTCTGVQGVSPGGLFGGLLTLSYACFSYWDTMADWLRFSSLLGALSLLVVLGWWRAGLSANEPVWLGADSPEPRRENRRNRAIV
jgi:hypothetical protein